MAPSKCAHEISSKKKVLRIEKLMEFCKNACKNELTSKLYEVWSDTQASITDVRLLFALGADPETLFVDDYGVNILNERKTNGSVCRLCASKYESFLENSQSIYDAQFKSIPIKLNTKDNTSSSSSFSTDSAIVSSNNTFDIKNDKRYIALSLDGGGMRGLVSVICLLFASRRIFGNESLIDLVNWTIGTSTGSLLALSLAKGHTLTEAFFNYWDVKNEIFLDKSTMARLFGNVVDKQTANVESVLERTFPSDVYTFKKYPKRLTVPALDISMTPAKLHIFRNYSYGDEEDFEDVTFKDAARASGAAPTYFHPHIMGDKKFVDGSLAANCPLNILFKEYDRCLQNKQECTLACIISIGTGEPEETNRRYKTGNSIKKRTQHLGHVTELLLEQVVGYEKSILECCEERCRANDIPFVRINPTGISDRIDQIDNGKLTDMIWKTLLWLNNSRDLIDKLGMILKEVHQNKITNSLLPQVFYNENNILGCNSSSLSNKLEGRKRIKIK
ncbi:85/88 kDa calcium-independent phospholipase A2 [Strongyloides ratti]|uniref:85/88 kDa calcium-independent phospholipase A2 n=1 Tax=Strongyloides ratti TaxID=34506 RepID=A0A090LS48_STRRB|nr:85/88 kDa calcium-independent phospholipase A2 [Strongyloides ratti]CEF71037.1 85/88 kDa calcium-independent phospholipase A2 [Strongyloides ratti]